MEYHMICSLKSWYKGKYVEFDSLHEYSAQENRRGSSWTRVRDILTAVKVKSGRGVENTK